MSREKKQLVVLGALFLMIVFVGAFQMMDSSSATPTPVASTTEKTVQEPTRETTKEQPKLANPEVAQPLAKRDPFAPSEFAIAANQEPSARPAPTQRTLTDASKSPPLPEGEDFNDLTVGVPEGPKDNTGPLIPPPPKFGYVLTGFVRGKYPAAVFSDSTGMQKLVEVGGAINASTTLVAIYDNKVKIKFHKQTLFLTIGGNPNDK
jgi:hypothetical protein